MGHKQIVNSKSHFISIKIYFILRDSGTKITINQSLVVLYKQLIWQLIVI